MKIIYIALLFLGGAVVAGAVWVRFAPDDPARWHVTSSLTDPGHHGGANSHVYRELLSEGGQERFAAFDAVIRATPRTEVLAGSLEEGRITYVTRSKLMGYPDYTTLSLTETPQGAQLEVFSRARYGKSDLGVNRARIEGWLAAL
ncbi:hypothetical protein MALG_01379 [Marinovum algicola DG 898]|nr:hypothetical protein MALG_01379 [Marinovum algicola DG 898]